MNETSGICFETLPDARDHLIFQIPPSIPVANLAKFELHSNAFLEFGVDDEHVAIVCPII